MIYLDYQATTPIAPEVIAAMRPWLDEGFGNPHSAHRMGREAAAAVEVARNQVMGALLSFPCREGLGVGSSLNKPQRAEANPPTTPPCQGAELYFTSGATEALNWALKGAAARLSSDRRRIVTLATEHAAVLDTIGWLAANGIDVDILPVAPDGIVDLDLAAEHIDERTGIVAAMLVNNEIGVIQPIAELGALARTAGALMLCDAVQGFGRVPLPLDACDMVALSAHKVHGPKGVGALWLREGLAIDPLLHGGGQEGGVRSGTLSPALCVGFGAAVALLGNDDHIHAERLWAEALPILEGWTLNGSAGRRYRGNLNVRREGLDVARLMSHLRDVAFSAGSACASGSGRPSHVLSALGLTGQEARSSIRLGFGRFTKESELVEALSRIDAAARAQGVFAA